MHRITAVAIVALCLVIGWTISAEPARKETPKALDVNPKPLTSDPSVKVDYDIVYVRAPRFVKSRDGKEHVSAWPEIGHPTNINAGYDLMLLHPDGKEEVLVEA